MGAETGSVIVTKLILANQNPVFKGDVRLPSPMPGPSANAEGHDEADYRSACDSGGQADAPDEDQAEDAEGEHDEGE
jgi:hypothetical protein